jgi:hypothetical protein
MQQSFAFVEYESRRDADDAYHEMHNKRIGRDDILKIEVKQNRVLGSATPSNMGYSGLELHHLHPGDSTQAGIAVAITIDDPLDVDLLPRVVEAAATLLVKTKDVTGIESETGTEKIAAQMSEIALEALKIVI